jgi:hypothetical protein
MKNEYTPKNWRIVRNKHEDFIAKAQKRIGPAICGVEKAFGTIDIHGEPDGEPCPDVATLDEIGEINAALIVNSPKLLEACKFIAKWLRSEGLAPNKAEYLEAVIKEATTPETA